MSPFGGREMLGRAIHGVDVVVAVVEKVAHLFPRAFLGARILAPQHLVQRGEPFMSLAVGAVQIEKGMGEGRGV